MNVEDFMKGIYILFVIACIIGVPAYLIYGAITNTKTHCNAQKVCSPYQVETYNDNVILCKSLNGFETKSWPVEKE